jgi:hypothetical protein
LLRKSAAIFLVLCVVTIVANQCPAADVVTGQGCAPLALGRDLALEMARKNALRNASERFGVRISSKTLVDMGILLDDFIHSKTLASVKSHDVLKEWERDGEFCAEVEAWIKEGGQDEADRELACLRSFAVIARGSGSEIIRRILLSGLGKLGLHAFRLPPDATTFRQVQKPHRLLADYVILVESSMEFSQRNSGIESYSALAEISLMQFSKGQVVLHEPTGELVFGLNEDRALHGKRPDQFKARVAAPLAASFLTSLGQVTSSNTRDVSVKLAGPCAMEELRSFKDLLAALPWVEAVGDTRLWDSGCEVVVRYGEKSVYLASMIEVRGRYRVRSHGWDGIELVPR